MGVDARAGIDGISGNQAGVPWVSAQMGGQAVRNVGQVAQGQHVGRVVTCNGYFKGIDGVDAPRTARGAPGARVDHHPVRGRGRITAPPRLTRQIVKALGRVDVKDDGDVAVCWRKFQLWEGGPGRLSIEAPDDVAVLVRAEWARVNGGVLCC